MSELAGAHAAGSAELAGRHAVVTGGSAGIGRAIFHALANKGVRVTILARDIARAKDEAARVPEAAAAELDVTDEAAVARVFADVIATRGAVDILVNNAGGALSAPFEKTDAALWQRMLEQNLTGTFLCTRAVYPKMRARDGGGRIINIASTAALRGYAYTTAYSAAKHGVLGLTRALALEAAKSAVTVNALCPGFCDTEMLRAAIAKVAATTGRSEAEARAEFVRHNPQGRLVAPEEVAGAVLWLCSDAARSVNGQAIALDGGECA